MYGLHPIGYTTPRDGIIKNEVEAETPLQTAFRPKQSWIFIANRWAVSTSSDGQTLLQLETVLP